MHSAHAQAVSARRNPWPRRRPGALVGWGLRVAGWALECWGTLGSRFSPLLYFLLLLNPKTARRRRGGGGAVRIRDACLPFRDKETEVQKDCQTP